MKEEPVIRQLAAEELVPELLEGFCHRQQIQEKWVRTGEGYVLEPVRELCRWSREKQRWVPSYLKEQAERGGAVLGAFLGDTLAGFAAVDGVLEKGCANLTMLFVDDRLKRRGIGRRLFGAISSCARELGADRLFISAVPSKETVAFYRSMGCRDAAFVPESFVDTEDDRYLEYSLKEPAFPEEFPDFRGFL